MGYRNAQLAYVLHRHHRNAPFRLLVWMALGARDDEDPPTYTGTREDLALALGMILPDAPRDRDAPNATAQTEARRRGHQAVSDALRALYRDGVVKPPTIQPRPGQSATYTLDLDPVAPVDNLVDNPVENENRA